MRIRNLYKTLAFYVCVAFAVVVALEIFPYKEINDRSSEEFSALRVSDDIRVISKEPHSIQHPKARKVLGEFLFHRLRQMGGDTQVLEYDTIPSKIGGEFSYVNIYSVFNLHADSMSVSPQSYVLLVAHYDSRYRQVVGKDTVFSYGAADDGYGVGVILETVSQLLEKRADWKQGVKVLFTDAEEVGMMGMTAIWENNREVFANVGLMINIEARGTWGPVLLFEACPGNEKVVDLYASTSKYPFTYSLTTVVYEFMPNFTDFTIVKDSIPGLNFSNIADVNHYHTHLDNFSNISEKTIQHYGEQVLPLAQAYLTGEEYSDVNAMRSEKDAVNFTIPVLGLFNFSKIGYTIVNVVIFVLFLLLFGIEGVRGRIKATKVLAKSAAVLGFALVALLAGELVAFVCGKIAGVTFKPFGVMQGIGFDNIAMEVSIVIMTLVSVAVYMSARAKAVRATSGSMRASASLNAAKNHAFNALYGSLALVFLLSVVLLIALGENMMFLIPLAFATLAMILYHITNLRLWLVAAVALILLHAFSFYFALSMALTIGALGAVMMLVFFDIMILIPLADLYLMPDRRK